MLEKPAKQISDEPAAAKPVHRLHHPRRRFRHSLPHHRHLVFPVLPAVPAVPEVRLNLTW